MSALGCGLSSSASCVNTATHPTSRKSNSDRPGTSRRSLATLDLRRRLRSGMVSLAQRVAADGPVRSLLSILPAGRVNEGQKGRCGMNAAVYEKLIQIAKARTTITYGELAKVADMLIDDDQDMKRLGLLLDEIADQEIAAGRPLLPVVTLINPTG